MLVEHVFVTTKEAPEALSAALGFLQRLGFAVQSRTQTGLEVQRGLGKPARAKRISDLPQRARLEFDRGRVTLAASVREHRKAERLHAEMLTALAEGLELLLAQGRPEEEACLRWDQVDAEIVARAARQRRRRRIAIVFLLLIILIPFVLAIALLFS